MRKNLWSISLIVILLIWVLSASLYSQNLTSNSHQYLTEILVQDSADTYPILLLGLDDDTSETFDLRTYTSLSSAFKFIGGGTGYDSLGLRVLLQTTDDDTIWATVDSFGSETVTQAKLDEWSGADSTYVKSWTFNPCKTGRFIFAGDTLNDASDGVYLEPKIMKQR